MKKKIIGVLICMLFIGISILPNITKNVSADLSDGLVGYWSFDDSNDPGHDDSGNWNNGGVHGATWTSAGTLNGALEFDGNNDYVEVPPAGLLDTSNAFTISAWFKQTGYNSYDVNHIVTRRGPGYQYSLCSYDHYNTNQYCLYGMTEHGEGNTVTLYSEPEYVDIDNWYFGVYTYDGNNYRLYLGDDANILEVDNELSSPIFPPSMSEPLFFGQNAYAGGDFNGIIDEVCIYNRALSESEIKELYYQGGGNQPPNKPSKPSGSTSGKAGTTYEYTFTATDPNGDNVHYYIDWGDYNIEEWIGPYISGEAVSVSHTWTAQGNYQIRAKAKDIYDIEGEWSDPLSVSMPKNKAINTPFLQLLENLLQNHPYLFPLLRQLLRL